MVVLRCPKCGHDHILTLNRDTGEWEERFGLSAVYEDRRAACLKCGNLDPVERFKSIK